MRKPATMSNAVTIILDLIIMWCFSVHLHSIWTSSSGISDLDWDGGMTQWPQST